MKKIPLRRCLGCYESKPKNELCRIVRKTDGEICLDKTGKINGRGAYICYNKECLDFKRFDNWLDIYNYISSK